MGVCVCVRAGMVNRAVTCATLEALVHTGKNAAETSARLLTSQVVTGCIRRETKTSWQGLTQTPSESKPVGNAASLGGFGPPKTPLLVHDPGGPAQIRHASADLRDNTLS